MEKREWLLWREEDKQVTLVINDGLENECGHEIVVASKSVVIEGEC